MAFKSRKRKFNPGEQDLLPFMNLFAILIPFLLSIAVFEKLGILELMLPERSDIAPSNSNVDPMNLNLTLIITEGYVTVGANGGFLPNYYYREEVEYRSKSDGHNFLQLYNKGEVVKSPSDGKEMTPFEKNKIMLHFLEKTSETDTGRYVMVAQNSFDEPLIDSAGQFYTRVPAPGEPYQVIGEASLRVMTAHDAGFCKIGRLSVYDEVARNLWAIQKGAMESEEPPEDIDRIAILAGPDIIYDKVIHSMDAAKYAGFSQISLSLLGG